VRGEQADARAPWASEPKMFCSTAASDTFARGSNQPVPSSNAIVGRSSLR